MDSATSAETRTFAWEWRGQRFEVPYEVLGRGPDVLLLPAFSTVSSREEMLPLARLLAERFRAVAVDWPGFGDATRRPVDYEPALFHAFLEAFVGDTFSEPVPVIAAGHAAGYAAALARRRPGVWSRMVLVAPTWRGPLPTVMGEHRRAAYARVRRLVGAPVVGQALYRLNVSRPIIGMMYRGHVYADPARVTRALVGRKSSIAHRRHARFASAAFVTGALDPVLARPDFLALFEPPPAPVLVVLGDKTPPRSRAEMDALLALPGVEGRVVAGALGLHEEYPEAVFAAVELFLRASGEEAPLTKEGQRPAAARRSPRAEAGAALEPPASGP